MNETLTIIMKIPLGWRVAIVMFIIWCIYALSVNVLLKIVIFIFNIFKALWVLIYRFVNTLIHIFHRNFGKVFIEIDQMITDFHRSVYEFIDKIKVIIECNNKIKRPFTGTVFIILTILTVWIVLPNWLHVEHNINAFNAPYHKYIEIENGVLDMVFGRNLK